MAKKKSKFWKYVLLGLIAIAVYFFSLFNGLNLIALYAVPIAGLALKLIVKLGKKWLGWDLSFLLGEETQQAAGKSIVTAQKKYGKKLIGKLREEKAALDFMKKNPGMTYRKARSIVKIMYTKTKKENKKLWK